MDDLREGPVDFFFSFFLPLEGKSQFHYEAVCNVQKVPVRLFNSINFFFPAILRLAGSGKIKQSLIILYQSGL